MFTSKDIDLNEEYQNRKLAEAQYQRAIKENGKDIKASSGAAQTLFGAVATVIGIIISSITM